MKTVYQATIIPNESPDYQLPEQRWIASFTVNGITHYGAIYAPSIMVAMTRFYESTVKGGIVDSAILTGLELQQDIWKLRHVIDSIT